MTTQPVPRFRETETGSLGWPAYAFMLAFAWMACWIFVGRPWSHVLAGVVTVGVFALAWLLHKKRSTLEVTGTLLICDTGQGVEEFDLSALAEASYHWVLFHGSILDITWLDGRALEFPVNRRTRRFRAALRDAIDIARPQAVQSDPDSIRSLRRAGLA